MKLYQPKATVGQRKPLVQNLLVVEGISRAGKFLLTNLLNGMEHIEPVQTYVLLEQIPFLEKYGLIDTTVAREILQCEIDFHCYEMLIGRTLNHRRSDKSSIFNVSNPEYFLQRETGPDGLAAVKKFYAEKRYSLFILHELMPNLQLYFDTFSKMKVISIQRSPIDLVYSWYKRGYAKRLNDDPTFFMLPFVDKRGPVPWFAASWKKSFYDLAPVDRIVECISALFSLYDQAYKNFKPAMKRRILVVTYEDILLESQKIIKRLSGFLHKKSSPHMTTILKREHLPNPMVKGVREEKLAEIKTLVSKNYFQKLVVLDQAYQNRSFSFLR